MSQITPYPSTVKTLLSSCAKICLIVFVVLAIPFSQAQAQIYDATVLPGAGDTYPDRPFRIYVPDSVSTIRGVYLDLHGRWGDSRAVVNNAQLKALCEEADFALLGGRFQLPPYDAYYWNFGEHLRSVLRALQDFARQSGHPELEFASIFFDGYSQGANLTFFSAWWKPEIAIGFIAQKSATGLQLEAAIGVPGYLIYGENDAGRDLTPIFERHRSQGALWSVAKQPQGTHARFTDRELLDNYFRDVIAIRFFELHPVGYPPAVKRIDESIGWLGDRSTFEIAEYDSFPGNKSQACWFPSQEVAQRWQRFVLGGNASQGQANYVTKASGRELTVQNPAFKKADNHKIATGVSLSEADASFTGESASDMSGYSVASAGDVNGDGFDDFLISAVGQNSGSFRGKTYLFLGKSAAEWGVDFNLSGANASFIGEASNDNSGFSVASAGDVNGDGFDDILIGAPFRNEGGTRAGHCYLILGRAEADWGLGFNLSQSDASFMGTEIESWIGSSISSAGDVNGDGLHDFLIGANGVDGNVTNAGPLAFGFGAGETYLLLGRASADWGMDFHLARADASFLGETWGDRSGYSVSPAGDVNGDGMDDFLIGAIYDAHFSQDQMPEIGGQTYLLLGRAEADWGQKFSLSQADASFLAEGRFDMAGYSISGAGDVNGDGFGDFLIGAHDRDKVFLQGGIRRQGYSRGQTYLILGKAAANWGMGFCLSGADASFIGKNAFDASGFAVASTGDVNGDGFSDILIGAPNYSTDNDLMGETYLILGKAAADWEMDFNLSQADVSYYGEAAQDLSGYSVASAGDVNGDGRDDFLVGAYAKRIRGSANVGKTYLLLGSLTTSIVDERPIPTEFGLFQNYPNPFNPATTIAFSMLQSSYVTLRVYNLLGQEVATLLEAHKPAGRHAVNFDASALGSGLYYYTLTAGDFKQSRKMLLIR